MLISAAEKMERRLAKQGSIENKAYCRQKYLYLLENFKINPVVYNFSIHVCKQVLKLTYPDLTLDRQKIDKLSQRQFQGFIGRQQ